MGGKFNGEMLANFQEVITDKQINLLKFSMISSIKKGKHEKFTAKGEFSNNIYLKDSISIYKYVKHYKIMKLYIKIQKIYFF